MLYRMAITRTEYQDVEANSIVHAIDLTRMEHEDADRVDLLGFYRPGAVIFTPIAEHENNDTFRVLADGSVTRRTA